MAEVKLELGQIEESDLSLLKDFMNSSYAQAWGFQKYFSLDSVTKAYKDGWNNGYFFSVKSLPQGEFKKSIVGFCGVRDIDWVSRNGELLFAQIDESGNLLTVKDSDDALDAFLMLVEFCLYKLGLNKVWFEALSSIKIGKVLEEYAFVKEGERVLSKMIDGRPENTTVYSATRKDYDECLE